MPTPLHPSLNHPRCLFPPQVASGAAPGPAVFDTAGQDAPRPPLHPAPPPPAPAFASPAPVRSSADVFAEASEGGVPGRLHISVQAPRTSRGHLRGVPEGAPSETFSDAVSDVFNPNLMDHPLVKLVDAIEPAMPEVDKYRVFRVPLVSRDKSRRSIHGCCSA